MSDSQDSGAESPASLTSTDQLEAEQRGLPIPFAESPASLREALERAFCSPDPNGPHRETDGHEQGACDSARRNADIALRALSGAESPASPDETERAYQSGWQAGHLTGVEDERRRNVNRKAESPASLREALSRIAGWSAHWKDDARGSLRLSMQLIHEEAMRAHPAALSGAESPASGEPPAPPVPVGNTSTAGWDTFTPAANYEAESPACPNCEAWHAIGHNEANARLSAHEDTPDPDPGPMCAVHTFVRLRDCEIHGREDTPDSPTPTERLLSKAATQAPDWEPDSPTPEPDPGAQLDTAAIAKARKLTAEQWWYVLSVRYRKAMDVAIKVLEHTSDHHATDARLTLLAATDPEGNDPTFPAPIATGEPPDPLRDGLDVEALADRLAGRTMLLQKALSDPSEPFIENWRTVARVLLREPLYREDTPDSPTPEPER